MKLQMKKSTRIKFFYVIGTIAFAIFAGVMMKYVQHNEWFTPDVIYPITAILLMATGMGVVARYMIKKSAKLSHRQLTRWMIPGLIVFYIASFIIANGAIILSVVLAYLVNGKDFNDFWHQLIMFELPFGNRRILRWLFFFTIAFFYVLWRKSVRKEQRLIEENLKYKYNTLKAQVNPHFLFNSLNTLSELVHTNADKADAFIQKLSNVYRYVLEYDHEDLVSLKEELNFVNQYFELQKERSGDKIILNVDVKDAEHTMVIPISIQMLVENALKHNAYSTEKPLVINITQDEESILVSNRIHPKSILNDSTQTGLKNLEERVKLLTQQNLRVDNEADTFNVYLPYTEVK